MLNKFRQGAQKAGIQATAFMKESSSRVQTGSQAIVQGFTLPGEAEKAAKILESFLGMLLPTSLPHICQHMSELNL
jgi:SH3 domain-containing YSC84-like protein 1